jgi:hypothetical protein
MWHYTKYLVKACRRRSLHDCLSWAQCVQSLTSRARLSVHPPNWILVFLDFSFHWVWLWIELFVVGLRVFWSCDQPCLKYDLLKFQRKALTLSSHERFLITHPVRWYLLHYEKSKTCLTHNTRCLILLY